MSTLSTPLTITGDHNRSLASPDITVRDVPNLLGLGMVLLGMSRRMAGALSSELYMTDGIAPVSAAFVVDCSVAMAWLYGAICGTKVTEFCRNRARTGTEQQS